jgi:uracil-DNA glycosylase
MLETPINHNEHNEHDEKPGRLVSSPHPTAQLHAPGKLLFLFVPVVLVVVQLLFPGGSNTAS